MAGSTTESMTRSAAFLGADTDALDALAGHLRAGADDLAAIGTRVRTRAETVTWWGLDGDEFRELARDVVTVLHRTSQLLESTGGHVADQSAQQKWASAGAGSGSADGAGTEAASSGSTPVPSWPPAGAAPRQVAQWWASLTPQQRASLIASDPARIGAMDGLPAADRSAANRTALVAQLRELAGERESITDHLTRNMLFDPAGTRSRLAALSGRIRGLEQVEYTLNTRADAYLLGIDSAGESGRLILALGDPDTADAVGLLVPGMTTSLDDAATQIGRISTIRSAALAAEGPDGAPTVSTVLWLGYDAPQGVIGAASASRAEAGSADLDSFVDGLRAAHTGDAARITAIGHSYGSLVVGTADREHQLAVDDIFFIGSPGVGVNSASQLSVGADHVYAMTMPNDVIRYTPSPSELERLSVFGASPLVGGVAAAELVDRNDPLLRFGVSPANTLFGGTVLPGRTDPEGMVHAHSSYFDPGPALPAIGSVIVGRRPDGAGRMGHGASGGW